VGKAGQSGDDGQSGDAEGPRRCHGTDGSRRNNGARLVRGALGITSSQFFQLRGSLG
jgi:hypothetical protein